MSSRHLRDSGFTVATLTRESVLAPTKAAVAVLLVFANHGRGHLRGRSRHQVGAGGLRLGGRRICTGSGVKCLLLPTRVVALVLALLHKELYKLVILLLLSTLLLSTLSQVKGVLGFGVLG